MPSLTPLERKDDVAWEATWEGLVNGAIVLVPTAGLLALGMRNPAFVKRTNWQSRTALVIMPALFAFGLTAEQKLEHKMKEIAQESRHAHSTVKWAEEQMAKQAKNQPAETDEALSTLYRQAVEESGVKIIQGDTLGPHHKIANYTASNPIKVLAAAAVPSVMWILYGNTGKEHLTFSTKLLHTRVFGQFATLSLLLGTMGFKEWMDQNGKFITEAQAQARVEEMKQVRQQLMARLEAEQMEQEHYRQEIAAAHKQDVAEHNVHTGKKHKKHKKKVAGGSLETMQHE